MKNIIPRKKNNMFILLNKIRHGKCHIRQFSMSLLMLFIIGLASRASTVYFHSMVAYLKACHMFSQFFNFIKSGIMKINDLSTIFTNDVIMVGYIAIKTA